MLFRLALPAILLTMLLAGCTGDSNEPKPPASADTTPVASLTPRVSGPSVGDNSKPPPASASSGGATVPLGIGTYCWSEPGKTAVCADAIGPITSTQVLSVAAGAVITVTNPVSGTAIKSASITAWSGLGSRPTQGTEQVWLLNGGTATQLTPSITAAGLTITASLPAGRYVVDLGLTYPQGGVSYGLYLEVR